MGKLLRDFEDKGMPLEQMYEQLKTWGQSIRAKIHRKNKK
jgi:hypothetical protein